MARKSTARDLIEIIAWMPWWAGAAGAILSYLVFTRLAAQPVVSSGANVNLVAIFASALRFVAPLVFVIGAVLSFVGRAQRRALLGSAQSSGGQSVAGMSWREFEMLLVGEAFRQKGYTVAELGGAGPDGGVDLVLRRGDERALVQCKHWKAFKVGLPVVREMLGAMTAARATQGWVITSGRYTDEARQFANQHRIRLVDGDTLPQLLGAAKATAAASENPTAGQAQDTRPYGRTATARPASPTVGEGAATGRATAPTCPVCSWPMVERVAKKGPNAGGSFWGCSAFPACKGTRPK